MNGNGFGGSEIGMPLTRATTGDTQTMMVPSHGAIEGLVTTRPRGGFLPRQTGIQRGMVMSPGPEQIVSARPTDLGMGMFSEVGGVVSAICLLDLAAV